VNDIPDWAVQEALRRCGIGADNADFSEWRDCTYAKAVSNLAGMIAKHEQPPVDPDVEAVERILHAWIPSAELESFQRNNPKHFAAAVSQYKKERSNG